MSHYGGGNYGPPQGGGGGRGGYQGGGGGDRKRYRGDDYQGGGGGGGGGGHYGGGVGGGARYRGGGGGGRYNQDRRGGDRGPPPKKPKTKEDEIKTQMKALLVRVGDFHHISTSLSSLEENVEGLAGALGDELATFGEFVADFVLTAAGQLSLQTPVYATLVGLLNARDEEFGAKVVKGGAVRLDAMIRQGRWVNAKLVLRFLAELVNARVVKAEGEGSLGELLTTLLGLLNEPDEAVPPARKDLYLYLVVSVLPWVWDALAKEWPDGLPALLETAFGYGDRRVPLYKKQGTRCVLEAGLNDDEDGEEATEPAQDSIQTALGVVKALAATLEEGQEPLEINSIVKPWKSVKDELAQGIRHAIPIILLPDPDPLTLAAGTFPLPLHPCFAEFDIFDAESGGQAASVSTLDSVERWVLREYLKDSLVTFRPFVNEAGNKRGSFAAEVDQLYSISYLAPPDVATEHLVAEALLLWLLQRPGRDLAYLHRLLLQVVQTPKAAGSLALGLHLLFQDYLDVLDHGAVVQLADWFGAHLTNTSFTFPYWDAWAGLLAEQEQEAGEGGGEGDSPQQFFLRRALDVAARQTYVGKVKEHVPPSLHAYVPGDPYSLSPFLPREAAVEENVATDSATTQVLKELVRHFRAVLQGQTPPSQVQDWLDNVASSPAELAAVDPYWRVTLVAHALSRISDDTVAHLPALLEKCLGWFRVLFEADEHQLRMVEALSEVWAGSPQMLLLALNAVMRMHMVLPVNLVGWLVRPEVARRYGRDGLYNDLFSDAIDRSLESVANYGELIKRALGPHPPIAGQSEEARARQFAGAETVEHGMVAVENAQDLALELVEGLCKVLGEGLGDEEERGKEWVRAGLSYLRGSLLTYLKLEEKGLNRAIPGTEPVFDIEKMVEAVGELEALPDVLRGVLRDARRYVEERQLVGGGFAHGQVFSDEE